MTEKLKQIIKEEVVKLPKEMQDVVNAFDWVKVTEEIGKKFLLTESEITNFQVETLLILTGLEYPDSYESNIEDNVGISKDKASQIANEAYQKIFVPINNIFIENIKKGGKHKSANWQQNVDFILSGGDYSAFVDTGKTNSPDQPLPTSSYQGRQMVPPDKGEYKEVQENENKKEPKPPSLEDIKSKLTI